MAPGEGTKIIRVVVGANTGDEVFIDDKGTHWKKVQYFLERGTGDRHAFVVNGNVHEV